MWNKELLDNLAVMSFVIGMMNYGENLSQSDKDDLIHSMSETNAQLLQQLEQDLEDQNAMLREILVRLDKLEEEKHGS